MSVLKQELREAMDSDRSLAQSLAKVAGYSNPTPIYKFVNQPKRELQSFATLLKIIAAAFPERTLELMASYIPTLDVNGKNARYALEYTSVELQELHVAHVERMLEATNVESRLWAQYYEITYMIKSQLTADPDMINKISKLPTPSNETYTLKYICIAYLLAHEGEHSLFTVCSKLAYKSISYIEEEYLNTSFMMRIFVLLAVSYIQVNEVETARRYLKNIKNVARPSIEAWILLHLGSTYMFTDFKQAEACFLEAIEKKGVSERFLIQNKIRINFLYAYWGVDRRFLLDQNTPANMLSYICHLISVNNEEEANEKMEQLDLCKLNETETAILYYFQYKMTNDLSFIYQAIAACKRSNEWFIRSICIKALDDLNPFLKEALEV